MGTMTIEIMDLKVEAATEVQRLAVARRFTKDGDANALAELEGDGPWMAIARRHTARSALGRRLVLVWRVAFEDVAGALLESCLVPVAVELSHVARVRRRRRWLESIVREIEPSVRVEIAKVGSDWRQAVEHAVRSFTSARTARDRAIADRAAREGEDAFQPGLFDRRAERARGQLAQAKAGANTVAADRLAASVRAGSIAPRPAQLLLVLVP
jgi:hypothetical protein